MLKKHNNSKRENGAVALIAMFIMTTLILLTAMVVDYGLFNYKGNKLQNAVDAAATAVAANLDATTAAQEQIARKYLTKNGFDGDSEDIEITIEHKGLLNEGSVNSEEYISTGYMKVTVNTNQGMIFSEVLNRDSMRLIKTAYVKCDANYDNAFPEALKYTLFAGSDASSKTSASMQINGRTGDAVNMMASYLESFINGVNESLVQPLIGYFGGETDYTDLVHINLSEAITDGDVHSNSDISIGIQALNASRTKDGNLQTVKTDSDGNPVQQLDENNNPVYKTEEVVKTDSDGNPVPETDALGNVKTDADGNVIYQTETVSTPVYEYEYDNSNYEGNEVDDYGQVTYTAVEGITFNVTSLDSSTHVYTQNQQYLEQTQVALNVLNNIDFSTVGSTGVLRDKYTAAAEDYLNAHTAVGDTQKKNILAQADNLEYVNETNTVILNNQYMIVYDISRDTANAILNMIEKGDVTLDDLYAAISDRIDPVYGSDGNTLLFQGNADGNGAINYSITLTGSATDSSGKEVTVDISGTQANRDFEKTGADYKSITDPTAVGASFSIINTFRQNLGEDGYIATPNLKPYFVREVNRSIRNSTQTKEDLGDSEATGEKTVKNAVKALGDKLAELVGASSYTDDAYEDYTTSTSDGYEISESTGELKASAQGELFTNYKESSTSGLTPLTGTNHTDFKGFTLFNDNGTLKNPTDFISVYAGENASTDYAEQFAEENLLGDDSEEEGAYGIGGVNTYYNSYVANSGSDSDTYETNYANDAVAKKRAQLEAELTTDDYDAREDEIKDLDDNFISNTPVKYYILDYILESAYEKRVSEFIETNYLPTVNDQTVTMNTSLLNENKNMTWADDPDGTSPTYTFTATGVNEIKGGFLNTSTIRIGLDDRYVGKSISYAVSICLQGPYRACVNGDVTITQKEKNLDVGNNGDDTGENATLVVTGNISSSSGGVQIRKGSILYCSGDITCSTLEMDEGAKLYCGGTLTVTGSIKTASTAVINASGMSLTGSSSDSNNGSYYCYGNFNASGDTYLKGTGKLYVAFNMTVGGTLTAADGFKVICDKTITAGSITATTDTQDASVVRGLECVAFSNDSGVFTTKSPSADNKSEIFCGPDTEVPLTYGYVVGGDIYFPAVGKSEVLAPSTLQVDEYGTLIIENDVTFTWILINDGGSLYVTGAAKLSNCYLTNYGSAYFLGGLDLTGSSSCAEDSSNTEIVLADTSDLFIGSNTGSVKELGNVTFKNYYLGRGNVYIENNVDINGYYNFGNNSNYVPNRKETLVVASGNTYVSGYTAVNRDNGVYISESCSYSTGGSFYFGSAIYNLGKFLVYGELEADSTNTYFSDKGDTSTMDKGITVANGGKSGVKTAFMYIGGENDVLVRGYLINYGTIINRGGFDVDGYRVPESNTADTYIDEHYTRCEGSYTEYAPHIGISNYAGAVMHCGKNVDTQGAIYNYENSVFTAQGSINYGMAIMNGGKFVAVKSLGYSQSAYKFDYIEIDGNSANGGFSIVNGYNSSSSGITSALFYAGEGTELYLGGAFENYGTVYINGSLADHGFIKYGGQQGSSDTAIVNREDARMYVSGPVNTHSNALFNGAYADFFCGGDLDFGIIIANCGKFVVKGDIVQNRNTVNSKTWKNGSSMSITNGFRKINADEYPDAVLYCGGTLQLGTTETAGESGSIVNMGSLYVAEDLLIYTNKGNSYFVTAYWGYNNSNTFVGGDFFAAEGVATGNNSIFMCGGEYKSKRSTKVNIEMFSATSADYSGGFYSYRDVDNFTSAYFYVGSDMLVNTMGKTVRADAVSVIPENYSRDFDIYSNSNIYVNGSLYANCKVYMKQNVTMIVNGATSLLDNQDTLLKTALASILTATDDYKLYIAKSLDQNICSKLIVNGSVFVRDTAKIRDMTKTYFYGNFYCTDYVEIGKALDGDDETEAKSDLYKASGENDTDYEFSNAGYMYVGGDFTGQKYLKLYASTTLRVTGDCTLQTKYVTLRHDAELYVGKKLKAFTSIDIGSYATVIVGGSMQASTSTIKIRDNVNCSVGGNMTALSYIELGKFGDYTRHIVNISSLSSFPDPNASDTTYKVGYLYHANDTDTYYYWSSLNNSWQKSDYNGIAGGITEGDVAASCTCCDDCTDSPECTCSCDSCIWHGGSVENEGAGDDAATEEGGDTEVIIDDVTTIDTDKELSADDSDFAHGSSIYIGKTLASYTSYIKEFAYSQVSVGSYVFAPDYITLRHNADMWVMPETFTNSTYVVKTYPEAENIWEAIGNELNKIKDEFTPKNGSIYTLGELTLNKNASLMGTWDCVIQGKCVLRQDSLIYMGHDFNLTAPSLNLSWNALNGEESVCGFDTYGTSTGNTSFPVVVYADNEINIMTTIDMKLTYLVANRGDVNLYDIYSRSENAEYNAKSLPNAICSYSKDINYFSMYGKLGALMYCPNGNLDIDGYYVEIWGSGIGNTVNTNTYYFAMHRFTNWKTMDLELASSGSVYLISQGEYNDAENNVDDIFMFDTANSSSTTDDDFVRQGASLFFNFDENGNAIVKSSN